MEKAYLSSNPMHFHWINAPVQAREIVRFNPELSGYEWWYSGKSQVAAYVGGMVGYTLSVPFRVAFVAWRALWVGISALAFIGQVFRIGVVKAFEEFKNSLLLLAVSITEVVSAVIGMVCPVIAWEYETWLYSGRLMQEQVPYVHYKVFGSDEPRSNHQPQVANATRPDPSNEKYIPPSHMTAPAAPAAPIEGGQVVNQLFPPSGYEDEPITEATFRAIDSAEDLGDDRVSNERKRAALEAYILLQLLQTKVLNPNSQARQQMFLGLILSDFSEKHQAWIQGAHPRQSLFVWQHPDAGHPYPEEEVDAALELLAVRNRAFDKYGAAWARIFQAGIKKWEDENADEFYDPV